MEIEFLVYDVQTHGDHLVVGGIVNKGAISLNDTFVGLRKELQQPIPLSFQVVKIVAYRNEISELPTGMGGQLFLQGEYEGTVERNNMLVGQA